MRKIACVEIHDYYGDYDDNFNQITNHITEFEDVDDKTFDLLVEASKDYQIKPRFIVLELKNKMFIPNTIAAYIKLAQDRKDALTKEELERARKQKEAYENPNNIQRCRWCL